MPSSSSSCFEPMPARISNAGDCERPRGYDDLVGVQTRARRSAPPRPRAFAAVPSITIRSTRRFGIR